MLYYYNRHQFKNQVFFFIFFEDVAELPMVDKTLLKKDKAVDFYFPNLKKSFSSDRSHRRSRLEIDETVYKNELISLFYSVPVNCTPVL